MFFKFFKRLLQRRKDPTLARVEQATSLDKAVYLMARGDAHAAIAAFREYLKFDPYNVSVLNNLGVCLSDSGNLTEASAAFELAFSLDDTYVPVVVNHAKMLNDQRHSTEALPYLQQAKVCDPDFSHVDAVYAGLCLNMGDVIKALHFQKRAWLANFDNLRLANCFLFYRAYADMDEAELAAEHRFWAETVHPIEPAVPVNQATPCKIESEDLGSSAKIRIGYWSPDFRNHSVRYFFRPLLENHDHEQFEIFLYHDFSKEDAQTELMRATNSHFHNVYETPDAELYALIRSHKLDIFVELAGHSSHNRVALLQQRFATTQITALGYPPTTGLQTIDAKLLDRHVVTPDSRQHYAESALVMPASFWCFDPMEEAPVAPEPPASRNSHITFGCVGNTAKINPRILRCWKEILDQVPNSRLLIRSINFEDPAAEDAIQVRLTEAGIALNKVDLRKPEGGAAFFGSYNEIDIILDTFPFNGGTTTCFAVYMGVPVVSWAGASLISRMGLSILSNLDLPELVVSNAADYVERTVSLAQDVAKLRQFRHVARVRFQQSSLGSGKLFAREFEQACKTLLDQKKSDTLAYKHAIPLLPADEIIHRAYAVLRRGQTDAAQRILSHCLRHYPNSGSAHLLVTQLWSNEQRDMKAVGYLMARLDKFTHAEQVAALITVARLYLLQGLNDRAAQTVERLLQMRLVDTFDRLQVQLYNACCLTHTDTHEPARRAIVGVKNIRFLIPCDSPMHFDAMCQQIDAICWRPDDWGVSFERCDEDNQIAAYKVALYTENTDILVIVQKGVELHNSMFLVEVVNALGASDLLGIAGATRWQRIDWRADDFSYKAAGFLVPSSETEGFAEIQWLGQGFEPIVSDIAVLDGNLLALCPTRLRQVEFDEELSGAELLLEEDWTHGAFQRGLRLAVHRNLGILINQKVALDTRNRATARMRILEKYAFDPFAVVKDDTMLISAPIANALDSVPVIRSFLEMSA